MTKETDAPDAKVVRVKLVRNPGRGMVVLLQVRCPHCDKIHTHGGGETLESAHEFLGHRAGHCAHKLQDNNGYVLTDPDGVLL